MPDSVTTGTTPPRRRGSRRTGRRSPLASVALLLIGLFLAGGAYAAFTSAAFAEPSASAKTANVGDGQKLFAANCASCHGLQGQGSSFGPSLIGVGAAAVDFQVGTGRMPLAAQGPQAPQKPVQFTDGQIADMAAWVASLGPGPGLPDPKYLTGQGDIAKGGELFRINCAMCHNVVGAGGALTQGKYAPSLKDVSAKYVYEAMVTGPQNMPVFNNQNLSPEDKANVISYLAYINKNDSPGGLDLGGLGPVSEGLFAWIFGLGSIVAITVWLTAKSN